MTIAELDYWAASRNWGTARRNQLDAYVRQHFGTYPVNRRLCQLWAEITLEARNLGRVIQAADAWVAATAIRLNAPLMTNNRKDFDYLSRLSLITPTVN